MIAPPAEAAPDCWCSRLFGRRDAACSMCSVTPIEPVTPDTDTQGETP